MVGVILIQRSEGGALSGLGGGTMGGLMTARGTANLLTRATAILAGCFMVTSLVLAILAGHAQRGSSILDHGAASGCRTTAGELGTRGAGRARGADRAVAATRFMATRPAPLAAIAGEAEAAHMGDAMKRFVFITGGVVSSLGKGLAAAALGVAAAAARLSRPAAQARSLSERRSRHDVALPARRGVRHRRRGGDRPRPRPLRALHRRAGAGVRHGVGRAGSTGPCSPASATATIWAAPCR